MAMPPTGNRITQGEHGTYHAVDYSYQPDATIYAPEDGRISAYYPNAGDAGNNLQMVGATGAWGFCHLERPLVGVGQTVAKGDKIGIMGYTGLTDPVGPLGRHLHTVLQINGRYVYPPDHYTEPFNLQGAIEMIANEDQAIKAYQLLRPNYRPTQDEINATAGRRSWIQFVNDGVPEREQRDLALAAQSQALAIAQNEAQNLRNTITQIQQVDEQNLADKDAKLAALGSQLNDTTNNLQKALLEVKRLNDTVCKVPDQAPTETDWITKWLAKVLPFLK